jgi:predicted lipid-binding transport protein (Tim44 family)
MSHSGPTAGLPAFHEAADRQLDSHQTAARIGRTGAILGPVLGGIAMGLNRSTRDIFLAAAVPALTSVAAMLAMRWAIASRGR